MFAARSLWRGVPRIGTKRVSSTARDTGIKQKTTTILGTSLGSGLVVITGTIILWPLGDMFLGPWLIKCGLVCHQKATESERKEADAHIIVEGIVVEGIGKTVAESAAMRRPVVYITLREASSPHDLLFVLIEAAYPQRSLGLVGNIARSVGLWWIVLFDIIIADPLHTRAVHFSIVLSHLKRALKKAGEETGLRPLVVIDHFEPFILEGSTTTTGSSATTDNRTMRQMLLHLEAWCSSVVFDMDLADTRLFADPELAKLSLPWSERPLKEWEWSGGTPTSRRYYETSSPFRHRIRRMLG